MFRCQTIDQASVKAREPQIDTKPKPAADDWGIADTDDWGTGGADDWGTEAADQDDWGIEGSIDKTTGFGDIESTMTDGVSYKSHVKIAITKTCPCNIQNFFSAVQDMKILLE